MNRPCVDQDASEGIHCPGVFPPGGEGFANSEMRHKKGKIIGDIRTSKAKQPFLCHTLRSFGT